MQNRQGMNKGMQGMRKKQNVNVYTTYGFLTTSKPQLFFLRIAPQMLVCMFMCICTHFPGY